MALWWTVPHCTFWNATKEKKNDNTVNISSSLLECTWSWTLSLIRLFFFCIIMLDFQRGTRGVILGSRAGFVMFSTHESLLNVFCSAGHWRDWVHNVRWTQWTLVDLPRVEFHPLTRTVGSWYFMQNPFIYPVSLVCSTKKNHLRQTEQMRLCFVCFETYKKRGIRCMTNHTFVLFPMVLFKSRIVLGHWDATNL